MVRYKLSGDRSHVTGIVSHSWGKNLLAIRIIEKESSMKYGQTIARSPACSQLYRVGPLSELDFHE